MAVKYITLDVTDAAIGIIAHGVNCQGKMNSGVAKAIRAKWPGVYEAFKANPKGKPMLGSCHLIEVNTDTSLMVANCYTQVFYGYGGGRYANADAIEESLDLCGIYAEIYTIPIYMPRIGCGLGGLNWKKEVQPIIEKLSEKHEVDYIVCDLPERK